LRRGHTIKTFAHHVDKPRGTASTLEAGRGRRRYGGVPSSAIQRLRHRRAGKLRPARGESHVPDDETHQLSLLDLTVDDLRCIEHAELHLHPGHNLIWGGNGSGKTSLLESIFLLGRGRSFRTRNSERLIRHGRDRLVVFGRTGTAAPNEARDVSGCGGPSSEGATEDDTASPRSPPRTSTPGGATIDAAAQSLAPTSPSTPGQALGVQVSRTDGTTARISGTTARSLTELTQAFPVQIIDPGVHKLVEEGGHRRRRWMDWAVFHVEHQFGGWWLRYTRILKQRNAALRTQPAQVTAWDAELARVGELIAEARRRFVESLLPFWRESVLALSGLEPELHYFKGWAQDVSLAEALVASKVRDESKRLTHPGPHRADVIIRMSGRPAREVLSRGQQKLVAVAMTLAQLNLLQQATETTPTLLLDDPAAELDGEHLRRFIEQVMRLRSQLVLTSLHSESHLFGTPNRVFHVEQGRVQPV
jgi:DNA replication and repair protein RecF